MIEMGRKKMAYVELNIALTDEQSALRPGKFAEVLQTGDLSSIKSRIPKS
jgi:hypothetical protein